MPDPDKMRVLSEIGYQVRPCCSYCPHATFAAPHRDFGTCDLYAYDHAKHGVRQLTIHRAGHCSMFEWAPGAIEYIRDSGFDRFVAGG
jgi:hypothetical protein